VQFLTRYTAVRRWPYALAWVFVVAAAVLIPGLDSSGLWEPQERQLADRVAPRPAVAKKQAVTPEVEPPPPADGCYRVAPKKAVARTLTNRAMVWGRDKVSDSDAGRRLPLALLGLLTVLASAGIAMRLGGARAGAISALVLVSMPLLVLQSRQLTSEIGTAAGGSLILYGLVALGWSRSRIGIVESIVAALSLVLGLAIGFVGGGALLGLLVPLLAYAAATGFGLTIWKTLARDVRYQAIVAGRLMRMRWAIGRNPPRADLERPFSEQLKSLLAMLAVLGVAALLIYQIYSLITPQPWATPPQREVLGKTAQPSGCYSWALGAVWRPEDDLRYAFDSTFEQIAYGTFPWGILGPIAMFALLQSPDRKRRMIGGLTLAWASGAWIACEVFQRKVGFTIWAGFPALAVAAGTWLDDLLDQKAKNERGLILVGLFVALAVINLGKDLQSFAEHLTSLLIGGDQIGYPKQSFLGWFYLPKRGVVPIPTKAWILIIGALISVGFAVALATWREDARRRFMRGAAKIGAVVALVGTLLIAFFWGFVWQRLLSVHLSSKAMFDTVAELKKQGDQLVIMGDMGDAPFDYAPTIQPEMVSSRDQVVNAIGRPNRVFAIAPQGELCQLHREIGGKPYYVLDDRNVRSLLLSNKITGAVDKNPQRKTILHEEPKSIPIKPKGKVIFDGRIELLGWSIAPRVTRGDKLTVTMFYKILQPVGANWRVLLHFDGGLRFNGDHEPINGRCQTSTWQPGDYIVDTYRLTAGGGAFPPGKYDVWTGFFTGTNPNWKNMSVSEAPAAMRDTADRVKITTITLD
jgi:4-amino-4-deoxy-L-arabinose transferase-like glycosyltransferase